MLHRFFAEEDGQSMVEYGLLISLIALVVVISVSIFGRAIRNSLFGASVNALPTGTTG